MNTPLQKLRYHGFTCPNCGSHMYGTSSYISPLMGIKYPDKTRVGRCNEHQHSGNGCTYEWDRGSPELEAACMYTQTKEEFSQSFAAFLGGPKRLKEIQQDSLALPREQYSTSTNQTRPVEDCVDTPLSTLCGCSLCLSLR